MIYFQQSAVVARRLRTSNAMSEERTGTLLGSMLTQLIMIGALVTLAAANSINKENKREGVAATIVTKHGYRVYGPWE